MKWPEGVDKMKRPEGESNSRHGRLSRTREQKIPGRWLESLFELEGLGKELWKDIDPDEFVRQLREGWE
jgi:hypothetical protein